MALSFFRSFHSGRPALSPCGRTVQIQMVHRCLHVSVKTHFPFQMSATVVWASGGSCRSPAARLDPAQKTVSEKSRALIFRRTFTS